MIQAMMGQKHGVDSRGEFGEVFSGPSPFDSLPEDCISTVISFTTPRDACVAATVSKTFESAVKSDIVWEKFLPTEYASFIPPSRVFLSKKELYFALCDPVLIEDDQKSFWLDKASGKSCIMLSMRKLWITWGGTPQYWRWISIQESRFVEVPELVNVCAFEMGGSMNTRILSLRTRYSAYIVYKTRTRYSGFRDLPIQVGVGLWGYAISKGFICFDMSNDRNKRWERREPLMESKEREDGWIEAEIGEFFNEEANEIEVSIVDTTSPYWKSGLIIQGIEFRPTKIQ